MSGQTPRAIILGGINGLLGRPLTAALKQKGFAVWPTGRSEFDPCDTAALGKALADYKPTHLFNTVAYTAVDKAEDEPEAAYALNRDLPALLAGACRRAGTRLGPGAAPGKAGSNVVASGRMTTSARSPSPTSVAT